MLTHWIFMSPLGAKQIQQIGYLLFCSSGRSSIAGAQDKLFLYFTLSLSAKIFQSILVGSKWMTGAWIVFNLNPITKVQRRIFDQIEPVRWWKWVFWYQRQKQWEGTRCPWWWGDNQLSIGHSSDTRDDTRLNHLCSSADRRQISWGSSAIAVMLLGWPPHYRYLTTDHSWPSGNW